MHQHLHGAPAQSSVKRSDHEVLSPGTQHHKKARSLKKEDVIYVKELACLGIGIENSATFAGERGWFLASLLCACATSRRKIGWSSQRVESPLSASWLE